jgi:phenylpropionate dioxygenase-like ring-hydroxylating dioxygenase large terminal subunit
MLEGFKDAGFADIWTPVAFSSALGKKPLSLTLAGERLVLFRGADGQVGALRDRCPHRGVALSLGKVGADGCLTCPFHGWRFAADGTCTDVPLCPQPPEKRKHLAATALPVRELGGLLWVYTRPGAEAPEEPFVPAALTDPRFTVWQHVKVWRTHWTRAMENMLDIPHLPFVHGRTIGGGMRQQLRPDSRLEVEARPTPTGLKIEWELDGAPQPGSVEWLRPNGMRLHVPLGKRLSIMHLWCVPEGVNTTRMVLVAARDFGRYNPLVRLFDQFNRYVMLEDERVVETSEPPQVPPPSEERSVATDRATLAFRRWYLGRLRGGRGVEAAPADSLAG